MSVASLPSLIELAHMSSAQSSKSPPPSPPFICARPSSPVLIDLQTAFRESCEAVHTFYPMVAAVPASSGLTAVERKQLPLCYASKKQDDQDRICAVCLDAFKSRALCTLPCMHQFHSECILPWLSDHITCPKCRCSCRGA